MNAVRGLPVVAAAWLLVAIAVGCGGESVDNSELGMAQRFIHSQVGYEISCTSVGARGDRHVWRCEGGGIEECWTTRKLGGTSVNWGRRSRSEDLLKGCPPPQPPPPEEWEDTSPAESTESAPDDSDYSPEEDLAAIELGHRPDADELELKRIAYLLDQMEIECPANTRRQLADFTANVILQLEDAGVEAGPIEILSDVRESSSLREFDDCLDLFALYTILRKEQG